MSKQLHHVVMRSHSAATFIGFLTDAVGMEVQFRMRVTRRIAGGDPGLATIRRCRRDDGGQRRLRSVRGARCS